MTKPDRLDEALDDVLADLRWRFDIGSDDIFPDASRWTALKAEMRALVLLAYPRNHDGSPLD